ncbi:hypothetical protein MKS88_003197 [Plasmodium brasilianum]|uniref:Uncharacterized protein n=1 Tax=Plasmodium brasilianum TaxID=5824 RepID=A0ACB9Y8P1_PLABR|nr:hypothetical protein MKS88_003197 [Plasmodium brasilianum]
MIIYPNNSVILLVLIPFFFFFCKLKIAKSSLHYYYKKVHTVAENGKNRNNNVYGIIQRKKNLTHKLFFLKKEKNVNHFFNYNKDFGNKLISILSINHNVILLDEKDSSVLTNVNINNDCLNELIVPFKGAHRFTKCYLFHLKSGNLLYEGLVNSEKKEDGEGGTMRNGSNTNGINTNGSNTNGSNTNGSNTNGSNTNGSNTNGSNTNGSNTNGINTNGSNTNGSNTNRSNTNGSNTNGSNTNGSNTNGSNTNGSNTNGSNTNGSNTNGSNTNGSNTNGSNTNGSNTNGSNTNGINTNGSNTNGSNTNGNSSHHNSSERCCPHLRPPHIERYINRQLVKLANELISMKKIFEKREKQTQGGDSSDYSYTNQSSDINNVSCGTCDGMWWDFYINKKEKPLKCFVYLDLPEGTVMLKPRKIKDKNFLISINALNDIRRNNKDILKNIYFKKFNITFDYIYKNCNFITLLINKFIDQPYFMNAFTLFSLLSSLYIISDSFYQSFLMLLSSEIIWNPIIYNAWCSIYHTTLPLKLFMIKQTFSYSKVAFDYLVEQIRSKLLRLETSLINSSLKRKILVDTRKENTYDRKTFVIATEDYSESDNEGDFTYI